jgi:hypothetical protein
MHRFAVLGLAAVLACTAGCDGDSRASAPAPAAAPAVAAAGGAPAQAAAVAATPKPGSFQQGGGFSPFYAEEVHDGRLYVFGSKKTWEDFVTSKEMNPMNSKRLIGKGPLVDQGPARMTMIVETTKDEPAKDKRILKTVAERYHLSL